MQALALLVVPNDTRVEVAHLPAALVECWRQARVVRIEVDGQLHRVIGARCLEALLPALDHVGAVVRDAHVELLYRLLDPRVSPRRIAHLADVVARVPVLAARHGARELLHHLPLDLFRAIRPQLLQLRAPNAMRHEAEERRAVLRPEIARCGWLDARGQQLAVEVGALGLALHAHCHHMLLDRRVNAAVVLAAGGNRHHAAVARRRRGVEALVLIHDPLGHDAIHCLLLRGRQLSRQELATSAVSQRGTSLCHVGEPLLESQQRSIARWVESAVTPLQLVPDGAMVRPQVRPVVLRARRCRRHCAAKLAARSFWPAAILQEAARRLVDRQIKRQPDGALFFRVRLEHAAGIVGSICSAIASSLESRLCSAGLERRRLGLGSRFRLLALVQHEGRGILVLLLSLLLVCSDLLSAAHEVVHGLPSVVASGVALPPDEVLARPFHETHVDDLVNGVESLVGLLEWRLRRPMRTRLLRRRCCSG